MTAELMALAGGAATTLAAAWAYWIKRNADTSRLAMEAKLAAAQAEGVRTAQLMGLLEKQLQVNQSFIERLNEQERLAQSNYRLLQALGDRQTAEIVDEVRRIPKSVGLVTEGQILKAVDAITTTLHDLIQSEPKFPATSDNRWIWRQIIPHNEAYLFEYPRYTERKYSDDKFYVRSSESVWIILDAEHGYHAVRRSNGTYGWILDISVRIGSEVDDAKQGVLSSANGAGATAGGSGSDGAGSDGRAGSGGNGDGGGDALAGDGNAGGGDSPTSE